MAENAILRHARNAGPSHTRASHTCAIRTRPYHTRFAPFLNFPEKKKNQLKNRKRRKSCKRKTDEKLNMAQIGKSGETKIGENRRPENFRRADCSSECERTKKPPTVETIGGEFVRC